MNDPLQRIIIRIFMAIVASMVIVLLLKPLITLAAGFMVCSSCDAASALLLSSLMIFGSIGVAFYKLFGVFYGTEPV